MEFATLKAQVRADAWPAGEGENLVTAHNNFFQAALADLVASVDCYKNNLTSVYPACSSFFNCGLSIIPAPRGAILSVFTVGKWNHPTDPPKEDWCSKAFYEQVDYCQIERYMKLRQRTTATDNNTLSVLFAGVFGCRRRKTSYPAPTDVGTSSLPALPPGVHYAQAATDAGFRSRGGVYAIYRGRIYIAPWIESDESLVIEWNGQKQFWNDADGVEDDPKFIQAVQAFVNWKHYLHYEENPEKRDAFAAEYVGWRRELIHDCVEANRKHECREAGGGGGSSARGMGSTDATTGEPSPSPSSLFWNEYLSGTVNCPSGSVSSTVAWTVKANTVSSTKSVADANAIATSQAQSDATTRCVASSSSSGGSGGSGGSGSGSSSGFYNTAQTYTASCPGASGSTPAAEGSSVTVTIPAGQFFSTVSQETADNAALAAAQSQAESQLVCTFWNAPQTASAVCPTDSSITNSVTIPAHTSPYSFTNLVGQFDPANDQAQADQAAKTAANSQAISGLAGIGCLNSITVCNQVKQKNTICVKTLPPLQPGLPPGVSRQIINQTVAAGTFCKATTVQNQAVDQLAVNKQALDLLNSLVQAQCAAFGGTPIG